MLLSILLLIHCKKIRISTNILWRVCHILTEMVTYTFVCVNRWNNEARAHIAMWASLFCRYMDKNVYGTSPIKTWKLATKYPWVYRYFYSVKQSNNKPWIPEPAGNNTEESGFVSKTRYVAKNPVPLTLLSDENLRSNTVPFTVPVYIECGNEQLITKY